MGLVAIESVRRRIIERLIEQIYEADDVDERRRLVELLAEQEADETSRRSA